MTPGQQKKIEEAAEKSATKAISKIPKDVDCIVRENYKGGYLDGFEEGVEYSLSHPELISNPLNLKENEYVDISDLADEEKKKAVQEFLQAAAASFLKLFLSLGLKTHIEGMIVDDATGNEYILIFKSIEKFLKDRNPELMREELEKFIKWLQKAAFYLDEDSCWLDAFDGGRDYTIGEVIDQYLNSKTQNNG